MRCGANSPTSDSARVAFFCFLVEHTRVPKCVDRSNQVWCPIYSKARSPALAWSARRTSDIVLKRKYQFVLKLELAESLFGECSKVSSFVIG